MTEKIKRTLDLKNEILSFYSTSENDKKIVDALCFATNTLPIVEARADTPYSSAGNAFYGEPDCPMKDDIIVKYR